MGGRQSKSTRRSASMGGYSSSGGPGYAYSAAAPGYAPSQNRYPSPYHPAAAPPPQPPAAKHKLQRRYSRIADNYNSLDEVTKDLAQSGLESSNLIVGIDFTKSNEWTGSKSFNRRCLHHIGDSQNPYEQAISIIGRTLSAFDEDNLIPCFGFGDALTHDQSVFSFYPDNRPCNGFEEALKRYRELVPQLRLAGPTSFAPMIDAAIRIVEESGGQYHVLLIIADGQVTRSVDTNMGQLSAQEQDTVDAIVRASDYPLSIVLVGVGDGPWDMMRQFDDNIPSRAFDNFQFVNFTDIMSKSIPESKKETEFALSALMEIPSQYKATLDLQILGRRRGTMPDRLPLPPPVKDEGYSTATPRCQQSNSFNLRNTSFNQSTFSGASSPARASTPDNWESQKCPICYTEVKNLAFGCGHQTCYECGKEMTTCPICRCNITTRIRLY